MFGDEIVLKLRRMYYCIEFLIYCELSIEYVIKVGVVDVVWKMYKC